eukprot:33992-Eustigmatos_ZCMA.PRE.1
MASGLSTLSGSGSTWSTGPAAREMPHRHRHLPEWDAASALACTGRAGVRVGRKEAWEDGKMWVRGLA